MKKKTRMIPVVFVGQPTDVTACLHEAEGDVRASTDLLLQSGFLAAEERERLPPAGPNPERRLQWLLARFAGKQAVQRLLRQGRAAPPPGMNALVLSNDPAGAPGIQQLAAEGARPLPVHISLAHTGAAAVAAAGLRPVGVDIESGTRVPEFGWERLATPEEAILCRKAEPPAAEASPLLILWMAKEAACKMARAGLSDGLERWRLVEVRPDRTWRINDRATDREVTVFFTSVGAWRLALAC